MSHSKAQWHEVNSNFWNLCWVIVSLGGHVVSYYTEEWRHPNPLLALHKTGCDINRRYITIIIRLKLYPFNPFALRTQTHRRAVLSVRGEREVPARSMRVEGWAQPLRHVTRWAPPTLTLRRARADNFGIESSISVEDGIQGKE